MEVLLSILGSMLVGLIWGFDLNLAEIHVYQSRMWMGNFVGGGRRGADGDRCN